MKLRRVLSWVAVVATIAGLSVIDETQADAQPGVPQAQVVSAVPATATPNLDGGVVYSIAQVGTTIISGGSFTSATAHGSTTALTRNGIVAFDQSTGAISTGFAPTLDGMVDVVIPGPTAGTVYVGGAFNTVNGVKSKSLTLLNVSNGSIVAGFKPPTFNGIVESMRLSKGELYLAGTFSTASGQVRNGLATVSPTTGTLDSFLTVALTGHHNYNGSGADGGVGGRAMDISPDGTRAIILGDFKNANGALHDQIVMLDITSSGAVIDPNWNTSEYTAPCASGSFDTYVEDVAFSPDGSYFAIAATGGDTFSSNTDGSRSLCDTATRWSTTDTGTNVQPTWIDYTGNDTFWSVAATGTAVYFGGHERWVNNPNGSDYAAAGALPRPGIAALDPASGLPLTWNPGRNPRGAGAYALLATPQGLWVGSDTNYIGDHKYKHDEIAYFPLAGGYVPAATTTATLPSNVYEAGALPSASNTDVLYRVDTGGPALAAIDNGPDWLADASDTDPGAVYRNDQSNAAGYDQVAHVSTTVPASTPIGIFSSERWSTTDSPPATWNFPVTAGTQVEVRLYFANRYTGTSGVGQRVFNVDVEGNQVLSNYDIVADAGDQTGTMKAFDITVPSSGAYAGDVNIDLTHVTENPLINGIEIVKTGSSAGAPSAGGTSDLAYRAYSGSQIGTLTDVPNTGIDWSTTRGAFAVGSTIFYGTTDGTFHSASFDGKTVGTPTNIDPYDDPTWDDIDTGSGNTYQGAKTGFYSEIPNVTGAFYSDGRMYYTLLGQTSLYWRYFTPDSGTIGGAEFTVSGGNFANTAGEFLSGSTLYYANRSDGTLHTVAFTDGGTNGANPSVDPSTDSVVSGPALDGNDWRARGLFAFGKPSFPDQPPVAQATGSCVQLSCSFDGSNSSSFDGGPLTYKWDFGDGTTGTGVSPSHGYPAAGTQNYTLTVTDDQGLASSVFHGSVTTTAPTTAPIAFRASAHSYAASATAASGASVTAPSSIATGDTELLFVSTSVVGASGAPAGWAQVAQQNSAPLQVTVYRHIATATDAGATIRVPITATTPVALQVVGYSGVGSSAITVAGAADSATATHVAPAVGVSSTGSWVISYWSDKSSTTTAWNLPAAVTSRDTDIGTGGGRAAAAVGDSSGTVPTGSYPAQTATVTGGASGKGAMLSLVLAPKSSTTDTPPVAKATASCANLVCSFDGSTSTTSDGGPATYAWDFGDTTGTGTGATPTHTYGSAGTYNYSLTVTDDQGVASTTAFQGTVMPTSGTTPPAAVGFRAVAHSYASAATTTATVTAPATVSPGDTELLFVSTPIAGSTGAPAGWTALTPQTSTPLQVTVYSHLATAADAGATITVPISAKTPVALQLADYRGVGTIVETGAADSATATHVTPTGNVTASGSWVVSYWTDKSSTTTAWNLPAALAARDTTIGTGGGHTADAIADSGAPAAVGTYPAQTATVTGGASGKGAMVTLVLAPTS